MALSSYLILKGQKQGQIKGGVVQKGREDQIEVNAVDHQVNRSFDPASGEPASTNQHQPFVITKDVDKASPLLYQALVSGELLTQFVLNFWTAGSTGAEVQYYTIELTNARIVGIKNEMPNNNYPDLVHFNTREKIAFTYEKITWTLKAGGITASADWAATAI